MLELELPKIVWCLCQILLLIIVELLGSFEWRDAQDLKLTLNATRRWWRIAAARRMRAADIKIEGYVVSS